MKSDNNLNKKSNNKDGKRNDGEDLPLLLLLARSVLLTLPLPMRRR